MTITAQLLQQLEMEFDRGQHRVVAETAAEAMPRMQKANTLNVSGTAMGDAIVAARLYGESAAIGKLVGSSDLTRDARSRFAQLVARLVVPNRDEARRRAATLFRELGDEAAGQGNRDSAAIMWMNSGLSILEMRNPTGDELIAGRDLIAKSLWMRPRKTVDFAYSQMNLAIADLLTVNRRLRKSEHPAAFKEILLSFDRSARVFKKHDGPNFKWAYHRNVVDALTAWLHFESNRSEEILYAASIPESFTLPISIDLSGVELVRVIVSNPGVVGLSETPAWIPTRAEVLDDALARIDGFDRRVEEARDYLELSVKPNHDLRSKLFDLDAVLTPFRGLPAPPFDVFDNLWNQGLYEDYLVRALGFLIWEKSDEYPSDRYGEMLVRLLECVRLVRSSWSADDIERLLKRQPTAFRYGACELARLGLWREGFRLLEATRGLVSSGSLSNDTIDADEHDPRAAAVSWVHVTNSPRGTYVFLFHDGVYSGQGFPQASGGALAAEFTNLVQGGLLVDQSRDRSLAAASAERLRALLDPVAEWIAQHCGDNVVLHPGGYYQSFALWSVGELLTSRLGGMRRVSTTPSRAMALKYSRNQNDHLQQIAIRHASSTSGFGDLPWSAHEPAMIEALLSSSFAVDSKDATRHSLTGALGSADLVHFTGHSSAAPEPDNSALVTYGEQMTVRDILMTHVSSAVVVLGSCQSALAMNMRAQDEMLSLQSAMYYAGAKLVVGTSWPIRDVAGFVFSVRFYKTLAATCVTPNEPVAGLVIDACAAAQTWMRSAVVGDVNAVLLRYGAPSITGLPDDALAFDFYDWGAFGVVGAPVEDV